MVINKNYTKMHGQRNIKNEMLIVEENYLIILRIVNTEKADGRTSEYHSTCTYTKHSALKGLKFYTAKPSVPIYLI